ncbi:hypothetical protein SSE37_22372 [Sagittula stellata E-37]|uniref:Uncharacterized protein n=1 Tax=Sagittula stellata (strain ATCC 700073 / DSM 11524 / E-37) TaxID=388399 RepID=A3KAF7_SAGS3|nr:hypothetical protein SSE37_22372 [Sagittula stellata E-37]
MNTIMTTGIIIMATTMSMTTTISTGTAMGMTTSISAMALPVSMCRACRRRG